MATLYGAGWRQGVQVEAMLSLIHDPYDINAPVKGSLFVLQISL